MIKLGFYGGGYNSLSGKVHLLASELTRKFKVIGGIFNKNKDKSIKSAKFYGIRHFESIEEMEKNIDIVVILTPTPNHFEDIKKFNKPTIIDKPLCSSYNEAKEIEKLNKKIIVTYNYTGYPLIREAKKMIQNGIIGDTIKAKFFMYQESFLKPFNENYPQEWRKKDYQIPNLLLDLGIHIFHLAYFLIGDYELIFKKYNKISKLNVVDDCEIIGIKDNALINFSCSKIMLGNKNNLGFEIYGTKGSIKWNQNNCEELILNLNSETKIINRNNAIFEANKKRYNIMPAGHPNGYLEAFSNYYEDIYIFLKNGKNEFIDDINTSINIIKKIDLLQ